MDDDDILDRVRRGVGGIHAGHGAAGLVHRQVRRRRRRRRVVGGVAAAVVVATAVPTALVVGGPDRREAPPAEPTPSASLDGSRPPAFFRETMGGRVNPQLTRFNAVRGQRYWARFIWFPADGGPDAGAPALAGAAVEQYDDASPRAACERYADAAETVGGTASCVDVDGGVARLAEVRAGDHRLDVVAGRGRLGRADADAAVSTATVFRDDGWAVTLTACACAPWGRPDAAEPPATPDRLAEAAADRAWVPDP
ncbi:hypothetical protein ABFT23_04405 [Nocardioides sp. C4-1]|uniref:hypothetical protein n=1 Tax=Nocardioides sp. C4-1 TaxID=3151851 RepID=UPI003264CA8B